MFGCECNEKLCRQIHKIEVKALKFQTIRLAKHIIKMELEVVNLPTRVVSR